MPARMLRARTFALFLVACAGTSPVWAGDRPEQEAASRVLDAVRSKDEGTLRDLARTKGLDAWLVADALLGRGEAAAAAEFARLAEGKDVSRLGEYVGAYHAP